MKYGDITVIVGVNRKRNNAGARGVNLRHDGSVLNVYGYDSQGRFKTLKVGWRWGHLLKLMCRTVCRMVACQNCGKKFKVFSSKEGLKDYICVRCSEYKDE